MSKIHGISSYGGPQAIGPSAARPGASGASSSGGAGEVKRDQVEISEAARALGQIASMPEIRFEKVQAIREALGEDRYDVEGKLGTAIDRMLEEYLDE